MSVTEAGPREDAGGRDLRAIVADGVFFSAMVGFGETYVPALALALGLGEIVAALVVTLPMLLGALFQLVTPWGVRRLQSYRRWVVLCACLQALSFTPLIIGALLGRISPAWLAVATIAYWAFGMATSPAWNAWVTSLVPREIRARFFAGRARSGQAALFAAVLVAGLLLEWGRARELELVLFAVIFSAAMGARFVSAWFLASQSEALGLASTHRALGLSAVLQAIRAARSGRVLSYLLAIQVAVNVAAPFFTPYMLGPLSLSYAQFMLLTATAFLARVAALPLIGRLAHARGTRPVLWWGAIGIIPLPVLWLVSNEFAYLILLQVMAGSAWAALEFATLLAFFEGIEDDDRTSVLSAFNLGNAAAVGLGALLGSQIFSSFAGSAETYAWLFAISSGGRLVLLAVLIGVAPVRRIRAMRLRMLAVRPSAGAVARPILATLDRELPDASDPAGPSPELRTPGSDR